MKLDRNINMDGTGKYALLKMRAVSNLRNGSGQLPDDVQCAIGLLEHHGLICYGDEGPGDQFFVMKYKDIFTASGLSAYAAAVRNYAISGQDEDLLEYSNELLKEVADAALLGERMPD